MNAKTSMIVVILCFIFSVAGISQNNDTSTDQGTGPGSRVGLRAGVVISKQQFDQGNLDVDPKSKFGLDLALIAEFPIGEAFAISPEFHWMQKGAKIEDLEESTSTLNYLEIPVLAKFIFGQEAGFALFAGPSLGYLISATDKDGDGNTNDIDLDDYKRTELGAHLGAAIKLGPVYLDARYILGFSNIANFEDDQDLEIHNRSYGFGLSLVF